VRLGPCGSSQATAKLRHVAERVVGDTESLEVAYHPPPPFHCYPSLTPSYLPLASSASCSLQRFNAIPCKFVCGQVYMVPGLSVSSTYPRSSPPSAYRLPPRFNPPPSSPCPCLPFTTLGQHSQERINTQTIVCARVSLSQCAHISVYTRCPKSRVLALLFMNYPIIVTQFPPIKTPC